MRYTRRHEIILYTLGLTGFLGLLLAGAHYPPRAAWLRGAALAWFIGLGLVRCLALLTLRNGDGAERAGWSADPQSVGAAPRIDDGVVTPSGPSRPWD